MDGFDTDQYNYTNFDPIQEEDYRNYKDNSVRGKSSKMSRADNMSQSQRMMSAHSSKMSVTAAKP
jgi:hypothetical protein